MSDNKPACGVCRFWQFRDDNVGECRRNAPSVRLGWPGVETPEDEHPQPFSYWPQTFDLDWCGEFSRQPRTTDDTAIADMGISGRTLKCLERHGFTTIQDILDATPETLSHFRGSRNVGKGTFEDVVARLETLGYDIPPAWVNNVRLREIS